MTFLAPGFLIASLAAAAVIVALHFIVTRQPRSSILPTARFVPDMRATTVASARRPTDLLLMLLRVVIILAAGAALAKPVLQPSRRAEVRVILADVSRSVGDANALRDSVRRNYRDGDALVLFDSAARIVEGNPGDTLAALRSTGGRGNLGAALIGALRAGSDLRDRADSLELVIVSPFGREELDAATDSIRRLWPGRARLVRVSQPSVDTAGGGGLRISADDGDPLAITVGLLRDDIRSGAVINRSPSGVTSSGAGTAGGPVIDWAASRLPLPASRSPIDTVGGVSAGGITVVAPFERRWAFSAESMRGAEVVARWSDGEPAAIEKSSGDGCVRSVGVPVTPVGDLAIRKDFVRFVAALSRPCARVTALIPADPSDIARLAGNGGLAPRDAFQPRTDARSSLAPWLLALALLAAVAELVVRRRRNGLSAAGEISTSGQARAA